MPSIGKGVASTCLRSVTNLAGERGETGAATAVPSVVAGTTLVATCNHARRAVASCCRAAAGSMRMRLMRVFRSSNLWEWTATACSPSERGLVGMRSSFIETMSRNRMSPRSRASDARPRCEPSSTRRQTSRTTIWRKSCRTVSNAGCSPSTKRGGASPSPTWPTDEAPNSFVECYHRRRHDVARPFSECADRRYLAYMERTTVKLPDDLDARLCHEARRRGVTAAMTDIILHASSHSRRTPGG